MAMNVARKMARQDRRKQLLDKALTIVREEGTDALTLGHLAEYAGVSKPIAYEHFGTRSGLLIALYQLLDDQQVDKLVAALEQAPKYLEDVARTLSYAYMDCCRSMGPEWSAISAALKGDEQMEAFQLQLIDDYVDSYCSILAPYSSLDRQQLRSRCVGIIGAAEAIAREMMRDKLEVSAAADLLRSLIMSWLAPSRHEPAA